MSKTGRAAARGRPANIPNNLVLAILSSSAAGPGDSGIINATKVKQHGGIRDIAGAQAASAAAKNGSIGIGAGAC